MDQAVAALLALPVPDGSVLASLPTDVQQARSDAQLWASTYRALATSTLQGVVDFGSTFDTFYDQLEPLADQIAAGQPGAISSFNQLLRQLQSATAAQAKTAQDVAQQLNTYAQTLTTDLGLLTSDQTSLSNTQKTESAEATRDENEAKSANDEINKLYTKMVTNIEKGHYFLAEMQQIMNQLTGRMDTLENEARTAGSTASEAGQEAAAAGQQAGQVKSYDADLGALQGGVSNLVNGWESLDGNFTQLQQAEKIHSYGSWTPALLDAAKADWDDIAQQAQGLLTSLGD